ncbi:MAG: thioesterase family protein [Acidimicrobiia bacterium]|nr:thioesterase family protein [Acidimicrobiia bacterium]
MTETFAEVTATSPVGDVPGAHTCDLARSWDGPGVPHGGVLVAVALRALRAELDDPSFVLRSATATFCRRVGAHDLVVEAEVLRRGNLVAQVRGDLRARAHVGTGVDVIASFGRAREGARAYLDATPPDVDPPADCPAETAPSQLWSPDAPPSIFDQFETRRARGWYPWDPQWRPGPARFVRWMRYRGGAATDAGDFDPVALVPPADLPGPAVWTHLGPDAPLVFMNSLEMSVRFLEPATDPWLLCDYRARYMGDGFCLTESDVWSGGRLVATCVQSMLMRSARVSR